MLYTIAMMAYLIVIALHIYFVVLEMALWKRLAPRVFRVSQDYANQSAAMASNQGLYNLFLVVALLIGFLVNNPVGHAFAFYGLVCVIIAGIWGGITVNKRIFFVQAVPAIVAIALRVALIN
jgi:putative membrane protein